MRSVALFWPTVAIMPVNNPLASPFPASSVSSPEPDSSPSPSLARLAVAASSAAAQLLTLSPPRTIHPGNFGLEPTFPGPKLGK
ncbi:hypothetical protein NL676_007848 [Syzygium grande]|nr:hypothetical protein NL676_007848 [Syzygium grande]